MKIFNKIKSKLIFFVLALVFPLSATGVVFAMPQAQASADSASSATIVSGFSSNVDIDNSNFNASSNASTLSSSFTGWQAASEQTPYSLVTAGVINTREDYDLPENYADKYFLTKNTPGTKNLSDNHILMINSKTSQDNHTNANFGYKNRSAITLDANSFYSFQVSLKGDANHIAQDEYIYQQTTTAPVQIYRNTYIGTSFSTEFETDAQGAQTNNTKTVYVTGIYQNKSYYFEKFLTKQETTVPESPSTDTDAGAGSEQTDQEKRTVDVFYTDDNYVGIVLVDNSDPEETKKDFVYVSKDDITDPEENDNKVDVNVGAATYQSNITYQPSTTSDISGTFRTAEEAKFYTRTTNYTPYSSIANGSVYLSGLTDEKGNPISVLEGGKISSEFTEISTQNWTTVYFFVATGNKSQSVNLELWLGSKLSKSTGVMFFDDVNATKYSESWFWQTYQTYQSRTFEDLQKGNVSATKLINLSKNEALPNNNFNFDKDVVTGNGMLCDNWKKSGTGDAQVFNVNDSAKFLSATSYKNVGSNFSATVTVDENGQPIKIEQNKNALALWAKNGYVLATSQENVEILANQIYKISAEYKLAENFSGSAYLFVEEYDGEGGVLEKYGLSKNDYTLTAQTSSSAVTSNGTDDYKNNYGKVELYVKGSALYNSAVKLSLGLGKSDETATGCVVFDNVRVEKASAEDYSAATATKVELGGAASTPSIANGNFNSVKATTAQELAKPESWTLASAENALNFAGVINTASDIFASYKQAYETQNKNGVADAENTYYWARNLENPANSLGGYDADNIFMFANTNPSWQTISSGNIALSGTQKIVFHYKTQLQNTGSGLYVKVYAVGDDEQKFELFKTTTPLTASAWDTFEIYLNSSSTSNNIVLEVGFGENGANGTENLAQGFAFLDSFEISSISATTFNNQKDATKNDSAFAVVDMSNLFSGLSEQSAGSAFLKNPAYTTSQNSGLKDLQSLQDKNSQFYIESDTPSQVFFINAQNGGTAYIQSKLGTDISAGDDGTAYYALTFKLKTNFSRAPQENETFGVTVGFDQFAYATGLVSNDDYSTYTIYYSVSATTTAKFYAAITCPEDVSGTAVLYFVDATPLKALVDSTEFDAAQTTTNQSSYDVNEDKVFVATPAENETPDDEQQPDNTESAAAGQSFNWLAIPAIIFGLAIVIAVVGWTLRKIKIKKIEIKRKESYDRNQSLHVNEIKRMAEAERAAEAKAVETTIQKFQDELDFLEKEHKEKVVAAREADKGKVSKNTDKEFKSFAQKRTVIAERIDGLKKQLEEINSPEHQLALERKIYAKQQAQKRNLKKQKTDNK